jgi:proline-specific peptidase
MKTEEGKISVESGYQIWYRRIGNGGIPLLTLHGGPGAGHDYLESLEELATERPVISYDQLGCGKSDQPDDQSLWRIERFVAEVDMVRQALGLEQIHLLGQSWGGWLAIEYMLTNPTGVVSLILASTSASIPQAEAETKRLKSELPPEVYSTLQRYEAAGDYHHPEYEEAASEFYRRHMCRLNDWPEPILRSAANMTGNPVHETMSGPNVLIRIGNLKDWDRTDRLSEITVPTLITVGRYDSITPACADTLHQGISNAQMVVFEKSAHLAHLEETEKYLQVVADFLARVEIEKE